MPVSRTPGSSTDASAISSQHSSRSKRRALTPSSWTTSLRLITTGAPVSACMYTRRCGG